MIGSFEDIGTRERRFEPPKVLICFGMGVVSVLVSITNPARGVSCPSALQKLAFASVRIVFPLAAGVRVGF
jgi:hypothetical protein